MILIDANLLVNQEDLVASTTTHRATGWKRRVAGPSTSVCRISAFSLPCESRDTPAPCRPAVAGSDARVRPALTRSAVLLCAGSGQAELARSPQPASSYRQRGEADNGFTYCRPRIEHGPAVFSADHDFERVPGVHLGTR